MITPSYGISPPCSVEKALRTLVPIGKSFPENALPDGAGGCGRWVCVVWVLGPAGSSGGVAAREVVGGGFWSLLCARTTRVISMEEDESDDDGECCCFFVLWAGAPDVDGEVRDVFDGGWCLWVRAGRSATGLDGGSGEEVWFCCAFHFLCEGLLGVFGERGSPARDNRVVARC